MFVIIHPTKQSRWRLSQIENAQPTRLESEHGQTNVNTTMFAENEHKSDVRFKLIYIWGCMLDGIFNGIFLFLEDCLTNLSNHFEILEHPSKCNRSGVEFYFRIFVGVLTQVYALIYHQMVYIMTLWYVTPVSYLYLFKENIISTK